MYKPYSCSISAGEREIYKPHSCSISATGLEIYKPYSCSISAVGRANVGGPAVEAQLRAVQRSVKFTNPTVVQFQQRDVQMWGSS